jgi:IS5 family transposase
VFGAITHELRRRSAIEPIIGHLRPKVTLAAATSKAPPATPPTSLSAMGHNLPRILAWQRGLLCLFLIQLWRTLSSPAQFGFFTDDSLTATS